MKFGGINLSIKKAVIVAAGLGKRLKDVTGGKPKSLLKIGDKTIIEHSIYKMKKLGIEQIGIVVGHEKEFVKSYLGNEYTYIFNPFYKYTNNMASLWFAKEFIKDSDFIYSHADIFYEEEILNNLIKYEGDIVLSVEKKNCDEEAMKVKLNNNMEFLESSKEIPLEESFGEWTGLAKFNNKAWNKYKLAIEELLYNEEFQAYDTKAMNILVKKYTNIIKVNYFENLNWVEVDFKEDYEKALRFTNTTK
jgi:choline kinase